MFARIGFIGSIAALVALVSGSCSSGGGNDDAGGSGSSPYTTDSAVAQTDAGGTVPAVGRDSGADAKDCSPFAPPVPCTQGTVCPTDSYCDLTQPTPVCTKYRCLPNGTACDNGGFNCSGGGTLDPSSPCSGGEYCMSGICLSGVCSDSVGQGAACAKQYCAPGLRCLGLPPTCVKPNDVGGACQDDRWCALGGNAGPFAPIYCLAGICGQSYCASPAATMGCSASTPCTAGSDCLDGACVQLYCGVDGIPCSKDAHCASGYGCISNRCRKLSVPLHCAGMPLTVDCSLANPNNPALGCTVLAASCSGTVSSCASHNATSAYACTFAGCQWDGTILEQCTGTPKACSALTSASECTSARGCTWTQTASGSPTPCSQLANDQCTRQLGCEVTDIGIY